MTHHLIILNAPSMDQAHYGILFSSRHVYHARRASDGPLRLKVWLNSGRPNPDLGKSEGDEMRNGNRVTKYSPPGTVTAAYLDPHNRPTDDPVSVLIGPESVAICSDTRMNTGQPGSGQVYAPGTLRDGDTATLSFPDGTTGEIALHFPPHSNGYGHATIVRAFTAPF